MYFKKLQIEKRNTNNNAVFYLFILSRRHKKMHTGDKPNKCHLCSFSTIQSSNLKSHLLTKHHVTPDGQKVEVS